MAINRGIQELQGTEVKINVNIEPINGVHMSEYDFSFTFYTHNGARGNIKKGIVLIKEDLIKADDDNYIAIVDTSNMGAGEIMCRITAYIPDEDIIDDQIRTEIVELPTGITIH